MLNGDHAHQALVNMHRRQCGLEFLRQVDIVKANDRYLIGYSKPQILQRFHDSYSDFIIAGENSGDVWDTGDETPGGLITGGAIQWTIFDEWFEIMLGENR